MTDARDDELMRVYERAGYDVVLPEGTLTLLHKRAPIGPSGSIRGRRLAIVTAYNPGHARPGDAANAAANERLRAEIERRGLAWHEAAGYERESAVGYERRSAVGYERRSAVGYERRSAVGDERESGATPVAPRHSEPSFAVLDVDVEVGVELGRLFDQAAIFYWDGRRGRVVPCA